MLDEFEFIDKLLDSLKVFRRSLEGMRGVSLTLIIGNTGGFNPDAIIRLYGPQYRDKHIDTEIAFFRLGESRELYDLHLDLDAFNEEGSFLLSIHQEIHHNEVDMYLGKVLALYGSLFTEKS